MRNNNIYNANPNLAPKLQRRDADGFSIDKFLKRLEKFCEQELRSVMDRVHEKMEIMLVEEIGREWEEHIDRHSFIGGFYDTDETKRLAKQINDEWVIACEDAAESFAVTFSKEMSPRIANLQM